MLFIGRDRFVHDDRYELIPSRHGRWTLKLKYVTARDAGRFECQVSTVPKLNQTFSLKVVGKYNEILKGFSKGILMRFFIEIMSIVNVCSKSSAIQS